MRAAILGLLTLSITAVSFCEGAEVRELVNKLKDKDSDLRRAAAKELGEMGPEAKEAVGELAKATRDKDLFVRRFSAEALGKIGDIGKGTKVSVEALALSMNDDKKEVQLAAVEALSNIGAPSIDALTAAIKDANRDAIIRKKAMQGLAKIGPKARKALIPLTDIVSGRIAAPKGAKKGKSMADDNIKPDAAVALGSLATPEDTDVIEALKFVSEGKQRDKALKKAATDSLRKINREAVKKDKKKKKDN